MKKVGRMLTVVLVGAMVLQPMMAMAGSPSRLIPLGKASVLADGRAYRSEARLPEGVLMACQEGNCMVQNRGLQLLAHNTSVFAVNEGAERWDVILKKGSLNFGIKADAKLVSFNTPHDTVQIQEVVVPADSDGIVRGTVTVTKDRTEVIAEQGMFRVATKNGEQLVRPGESIVLAQSEIPGGGAGAGAGEGAGAGAGEGAGAGSGAGEGAGAGAGAGAGGGAAGGTAGVVGGTTVSVAATTGVLGGVVAGVVGAVTSVSSSSTGGGATGVVSPH